MSKQTHLYHLVPHTHILYLAFCGLTFVLLVSACSIISTPTTLPSLAGTGTLVSTTELPLPTDTPLPTLTETETAAPSQTQTSTSTETMTLSATPSFTATLTPAPSATPTIQPTYAILRGEVNTAQVMCFYGPSKAYLFKYALIGGSNLEIIGILPDTQYIQVRAIGGDNPCWMNLEWMDVKGDIAALEPIDPLNLVLPSSPYYGPLSSVTANRSGNTVTISWSPLTLRAGDSSEQEPYLVETWVCQGGKYTFIPLGVYETTVTVTDETGCDQASHGRVYGVEKHGYTKPLEIPWVAAEQ